MGKAARGRAPSRGWLQPDVESPALPILAEPVTTRALVPKKKRTAAQLSRAKNGQSIISSAGPITSLTKFLKDGKDQFMELAKLAPLIEPGLACVIETYDKLAGPAKKHFDLDQACKTHDVDPFHFMSVVAEAAMKYRDNASIIIAAMSMPSIVEKSVKVAMTTEGHKDREFLFKHSKFVPTPEGTRISMHNQNMANAAAAATPGLPSFERRMLNLEDE